jgi:hypothetical protein
VTGPLRRVGPIELCITRRVTALLAMLTGHLICAIKTSSLAAFVAWLFLGE